MEIKIAFEKRTISIENQPFELLINKNLIDNPENDIYNLAWYVELQRFSESENDELKLQNLMVEIIQKILGIADIKIVGTTLHRNIYEIIFFSKEEDMAKIGAEFIEMPDHLEDREDRFVQFYSKKEPDWLNVKPYFELVSQY